MASIVLRDVEKYFGDNYIVRKLNLEIRHREFLVLLGPSGCGKTTTLRAIAGLEDIDSGEILIEGQPVAAQRARGHGRPPVQEKKDHQDQRADRPVQQKGGPEACRPDDRPHPR